MADERLEEIRDLRMAKRAKLIQAGSLPYPAESKRTVTLAELTEGFDARIQDGTAVVVLGRISAMRTHGAIAFVDIIDDGGKMQLQFTQDTLGNAFDDLAVFDAGDFIEVVGVPAISKRGEKTIAVSQFRMLSKALRPIPSAWFGLQDIEQKSRQRELDLLANPDTKEIMKKRSKTLSFLRSYLEEKGFMEVETPMLQPIPGGTLAEPFSTHHNALNAELFLRIAPELYLKRLLVGGFEKVFEIGKNFRNEGVDKSHNPEFTMLEFYWAYADYEDLMDVAEDIISKSALAITGSYDVPRGDTTISFKGPFKRYSYIDLIKERTGIDVLTEKNPNIYKEAFKKHHITPPEVENFGKLVDELYKEIIRPTLQEPTILYDYPIELVPLAKKKASNPNVAEMFQLVIAGMEVVKAYSELNDPIEQKERFVEQQAERDNGNPEAHAIDESYLRALEYGMPPAAGFGLGIDRLVMLLTNSTHVRDIILFPLLKEPVE